MGCPGRPGGTSFPYSLHLSLPFLSSWWCHSPPAPKTEADSTDQSLKKERSVCQVREGTNATGQRGATDPTNIPQNVLQMF